MVSLAWTYFVPKNWHWSSVNTHSLHEVPLHYVKYGVWCTINAKQITGPTCCVETINSDMYMRLILTESFVQLTEEEQLYTWFQQDSVTAHTTDDSLAALEVFGSRIINHGS
jgi:hypothetical protein